jgi:hypothetical protein
LGAYGACTSLALTLGCSSSDHPPFAEEQPGLGCSSAVRTCDIHEAACRQDVLDAVACLRDYDEQVEQPKAHFIRLSDLLEAPPGADDAENGALRLGYSLFGLVSPEEVDGEAAQAAQVDDLAALYSAEEKAVFILEDPGGDALEEGELSVSRQAYLMSILAHEYVHFLQDREFDLKRYSDDLSERFDPMLAEIAAVEGEAMLYETFFSFQAAGVPATDERVLGQFEHYIDFSEEAIRSAESPALEARGLFPYTYGGHSNAVLHRDDGVEGVAALREATSTLEFIQRRWGEVEPAEAQIEAADLDLGGQGFDKLGEEQFGPWVLNAFWSRTLGSSTSEALEVAQLWQGDRLGVWRHPETGETVGSWVIAFASDAARDDRLARWAGELAKSAPRSDTAWKVTVAGERLEITSSTAFDSQAVPLFTGEAGAPDGSGSSNRDDAGASTAEYEAAADWRSPRDAGVLDAGVRLEATRSSLHLVSTRLSRLPHDSLPGANTLKHRLRSQRRLQRFVRQRQSRLW